MNVVPKLIKYELRDILRGKWIIAYAGFFFLLTDALFRFGGNGSKALLSLLNVVLSLIPLVSVVFGTMYLYNSREFTELLLSQPVSRGALFSGLYWGLSLPLAAAFLIGVGLPFAFYGLENGADNGILVMLLATGIMLTLIFVALAFWSALRFEDRVKGLGVSILIWLFATIIYDGIILFVVNAFSDYPLEKPILLLVVLNPVDLARVFLLMNFDVSALMGYTGAAFERFLGTSIGLAAAFIALGVWFVIPYMAGRRLFIRKDF